MRKEILTKEQIELLPLVAKFSRSFGLVGGTAIALYIGHRESIDFDLFSLKKFQNNKIKKKITEIKSIERIARDEEGQYTLIVNGVYFTFFHYPFKIKFTNKFEDIIRMPDLLTLAAMKAHALGRRAKWKDYVDLYFIIKGFHGLEEITDKAKEFFQAEFNEKIFREQLNYFDDISYSEKVVYKKGYAIDDEVIKKGLVEFSLS